MNQVEIVGNLTRNPIIKATNTGKTMARFSVAVDRSFVTPQGESKNFTDYINVVAWGATAEAAGNYLKKGSRVFVLGRYTNRTWDTPEGIRKYITEVTTNFIACPLGSWEWEGKKSGNTRAAPAAGSGKGNFSGNGSVPFSPDFGPSPHDPGSMNPFNDNPFM